MVGAVIAVSAVMLMSVFGSVKACGYVRKEAEDERERGAFFDGFGGDSSDCGSDGNNNQSY